MIANKQNWTLERLRALPQVSQITRHICVEGWSAIGKWGGVPSVISSLIGADTTAKYVGFKCADNYYSSIDMATALHPQTILALTFRDQVLPREFGFPMKLRVPTKLGFKNPKHIMAMYVTNDYPGGYWEDQGSKTNRKPSTGHNASSPALVFPVAAGIIIGDEHGHDVLGVLEAEFGRHTELHREPYLRRQRPGRGSERESFGDAAPSPCRRRNSICRRI